MKISNDDRCLIIGTLVYAKQDIKAGGQHPEIVSLINDCMEILRPKGKGVSNMYSSFNKEKALDLLRKRGICRVVLEFSGGNDEGGVDVGHYYAPVKATPDVRGALNLEPVELVEVTLTNSPDDLTLIEACEDSVYAKYHSFAGEFDVHGTVTFDVEAGTVLMDAQESETVWKPVGGEL